MKLEETPIKRVVCTPDEWEQMPQDQKKRLMNLERKIKQYEGMLKTFVMKHTKKLPTHKKLEELLEANDDPHYCVGCIKK